jgi:hypothetical protein
MMSNLLSQSIQQDPEQSPDLQANNNNQQNNISGSGVINSDSTGTTTGGTPLKSSSYTSYGPAQAVASEPAPITAAEVAVMATATTAATAGALLLARTSKTAARQQAINYFTSQNELATNEISQSEPTQEDYMQEVLMQNGMGEIELIEGDMDIPLEY